MGKSKILVIAPHLDDEVLGCGGVICRHVACGDEVHVCFIAHRVYNHVHNVEKMKIELQHAKEAKIVLDYYDFHFLDLLDERLDSCIQDIIIPLEECFQKIKPNIVYSPFYNDNNQDHRAVAEAVQVVLRPFACPFTDKWVMYETLSSTDQAPNVGKSMFAPTAYRNVTEYIDSKISALSCYETEVRKFPHPRSAEAIRALAMKRGVEVGYEYAEAFMIIRDIK